MPTIAERVQDAIQSRNTNVPTVAARVGLSIEAVEELLSGREPVRGTDLRAVANYLGRSEQIINDLEPVDINGERYFSTPGQYQVFRQSGSTWVIPVDESCPLSFTNEHSADDWIHNAGKRDTTYAIWRGEKPILQRQGGQR